MDRFDLYAALYVLCVRWHGGQWSRGYRILCRLDRAGFRPPARALGHNMAPHGPGKPPGVRGGVEDGSMERFALSLETGQHLAEADSLADAVALADRLADYHRLPVLVSPPRHLWLVGERVAYPASAEGAAHA